MLLNKARLESYMDKYGIDAIVGTTHLNVSYMTDLDCWFYRSFKDYMFSPGASAKYAHCWASKVKAVRSRSGRSGSPVHVRFVIY